MEKALSRTKGVLDVNVNPDEKVVAVSYNNEVTDEAALKAKLAKLDVKVKK